MLSALSIQNIVLIDTLNLNLSNGLTALTGETGAGKSILLDALGLVLGKRADSGLVRHGQKKGSVTAGFDIETSHPVFKILDENDISHDGDIILRRTLTVEGKSKAYINDTLVSVTLLKQVAMQLVEIHGQFDTSGLLDPKTHLDVLDQFGELQDQRRKLGSAFDLWRTAEKALLSARTKSIEAREQEDYLRHSLRELEKLAPQIGEEEVLSNQRKTLMHREKIIDGYNAIATILDQENGIDEQLQSILGALDKISEFGSPPIKSAQESMNRAALEIEDARAHLDSITQEDAENIDANAIEERLFALKDCARKHHCKIDDLPTKFADLQDQLNLVDHLEATLNNLETKVIESRSAYFECAKKLTIERTEAGKILERAVTDELPELKLDKAKFIVEISNIEDEKNWTAKGINSVQFMIATNVGSTTGAIHKVASGGELSRFMLALKVVLAKISAVPSLIFDEVDSGVGGATANAVGARLQKLAQGYQILVVTHSPQVAAKARNQLQVIKTSSDKATLTSVKPLDTNARLEEIARMISGADITDEARAAAAKLIQAKAA